MCQLYVPPVACQLYVSTVCVPCTHLFVLVRRHCDERRLLKGVRVKGIPAHGEYVVSLDHVDTGLVLVHRVQDDLEGERITGNRTLIHSLTCSLVTGR